MTNPIQLAYQAARYVPTEAYRTHRERRKKMYNPVRTAPTLVQAMVHLGEGGMPLKDARARAKDAIREPGAQRHIDGIEDWAQLRDFLDTLALFLKAEVDVRKGRKRGRQAMRNFVPRGDKRWKTAELVPTAQQLAQKIDRTRDVNENKLKKLESRIKGCRDKWEILASLAQYYPLSGVPAAVIDDWVGYLGEMHFNTFKELVSYTVVLYRAQGLKKKG